MDKKSSRYSYDVAKDMVFNDVENVKSEKEEKAEKKSLTVKLGGKTLHIPLDWDTFRALLDDRIHTGG